MWMLVSEVACDSRDVDAQTPCRPSRLREWGQVVYGCLCLGPPQNGSCPFGLPVKPTKIRVPPKQKGLSNIWVHFAFLLPGANQVVSFRFPENPAKPTKADVKPKKVALTMRFEPMANRFLGTQDLPCRAFAHPGPHGARWEKPQGKPFVLLFQGATTGRERRIPLRVCH